MNSYIYIIVLLGLLNAQGNIQLVRYAAMQKIFPSYQLKDIPNQISHKIEEIIKNPTYTTSYSYPADYSKTTYRDPYQKKTVVVNVFPKAETLLQSFDMSTINYDILDTSTTSLQVNATQETHYQTHTALNYSDPMSVNQLYQTVAYSVPEFQHQLLVYPTKIQVSHMTSTTFANLTALVEEENNLPFV